MCKHQNRFPENYSYNLHIYKLTQICSFSFFLQKYKANAEPPNVAIPRDTDAEFNKLRANYDSIAEEEEDDRQSPVLIKSALPRRKSLKKKAVRSSLPLKFRFGQKVIITIKYKTKKYFLLIILIHTIHVFISAQNVIQLSVVSQ